MDQLKVCSKCKQSKPRSEFHKDKSMKGGLHFHCKVCRREAVKKWREANKERQKEYYQANKERQKERRKEYDKNWYEANKERKKEYLRHRYATDPEFRVKCILRDELRRLFKLSGLKREKRSIELLGVSWKEAHNRLIKTLPEGYTEQDWLDGKLHVDHKIPIAWFKRLYGTLTEDLIKRINHISNLQLIPKEQNISKGDRYGHGINNEIILYENWVITEQLSTISH